MLQAEYVSGRLASSAPSQDDATLPRSWKLQMKELALIECVGAIQLDRRPRPKERLGSSRGCQLKAECPSTDSRLAYVRTVYGL